MTEFKTILNELLESSKLSYEDLAFSLQLDLDIINNWQLVGYKPISDLLSRIADFFDIAIERLTVDVCYSKYLFGVKLSKLLSNKGFAISYVAEELRIDIRVIEDYVYGRSIPDDKHLKLLCRLFGVEKSDLDYGDKIIQVPIQVITLYSDRDKVMSLMRQFAQSRMSFWYWCKLFNIDSNILVECCCRLKVPLDKSSIWQELVQTYLDSKDTISMDKYCLLNDLSYNIFEAQMKFYTGLDCDNVILFNKQLKMLMASKGYSQADLSALSGVSRTYISHCTYAGRPSPNTLSRIADALEVDSAALTNNVYYLKYVFGSQLRKLLINNDITIVKLADSTGILRQTIASYIRGVEFPTVQHLLCISKYFSVDVSTFNKGMRLCIPMDDHSTPIRVQQTDGKYTRSKWLDLVKQYMLSDLSLSEWCTQSNVDIVNLCAICSHYHITLDKDANWFRFVRDFQKQEIPIDVYCIENRLPLDRFTEYVNVLSNTGTLPFGKVLKSLLIYRHVSQETLAAKLGISDSNITRWIRGAKPPSDTIPQIAKLLKVSISRLIDNTYYIKYNFGDKLSKEMEDRGLTVQELANETGIAAHYIYHYVHGSRFPTNEHLRVICKCLNLNQDDCKENDITKIPISTEH